jgi:hypothetical protein
MEIKIKTGEDFSKLLDVLAYEILEAYNYHQIYCNVMNSMKDHTRAFNQGNTFWTFTIAALHDAVIIRLCRIYDQESSSLSLVNLLETIKSNLHLFTEQYFRDRLKDNEYVDSLADRERVPSEQELEEDIAYSSNSNPLVHKLTIWRNNFIAHRGAKVSLGKAEILENNSLLRTDIENLLDKSFTICNHYSSLYRASTHARQIVGINDYKSLLNLINLGLDKWDKNIYGAEGQGNNLIVPKVLGSRSGWDEAFSLMAERHDDRLLDNDRFIDWD